MLYLPEPLSEHCHPRWNCPSGSYGRTVDCRNRLIESRCRVQERAAAEARTGPRLPNRLHPIRYRRRVRYLKGQRHSRAARFDCSAPKLRWRCLAPQLFICLLFLSRPRCDAPLGHRVFRIVIAVYCTCDCCVDCFLVIIALLTCLSVA